MELIIQSNVAIITKPLTLSVKDTPTTKKQPKALNIYKTSARTFVLMCLTILINVHWLIQIPN